MDNRITGILPTPADAIDSMILTTCEKTGALCIAGNEPTATHSNISYNFDALKLA